MILLDTDTCIEFIRNNNAVVFLLQETVEVIAVSFMTQGELYYGAHNSNRAEKNISLVTSFLKNTYIIHSDKIIMAHFGLIKSNLKKEGNMIGDPDILIGATALRHNCALITGNISHFKRIPNLAIKNWRQNIL